MTELTLRRRVKNGKHYYAPFIDGWNVWDIPVGQWTPEVAKAILHAYELGWAHCNAAQTTPPDVDLTGLQFKDSTND